MKSAWWHEMAFHDARGGLVVSSPLEATATRTSAHRAQQLADAPPAVDVHELSKTFRLPHQRYSTLKERALHPFAARTHDSLEALVDVTFQVKQGEFFGVV